MKSQFRGRKDRAGLDQAPTSDFWMGNVVGRHRFVTWLLGLVLLFAGLMKYRSLTEAAINPDLIDLGWWLLLGAFTTEVVLGLWLVSGLFPLAARWLSILCFCSFALFSFVKGVRGEPSCGCLGALQINPWVMFVFDAAAVIALATVKPARAAVEGRWAWNLVGLAGIVALGVGLGFRAYESVTRISRRLIVSEQYHQFEGAGQGQFLTHVFTIENRCGFAVEITESKSTCSCTTSPDVTGRVIEPGQTFELPITLDTGESDEHIVGGVNLFCRKAGSEAPPSFFRRLKVSAKVDPDYWVGPTAVDFGRVRGGKVESRQVFVRSNRMRTVRVVDFESSHLAFGGAVAKGRTAEGDLALEVTFDGRKLTRSASIAAPIIVRTSSPNRPMFRLLALVSYESPLEVEPSAVVVGSDLRGEVVREINLRATSPVTVGEVHDTHGLKITVTPAASDETEWRVLVRIPEVGPSGLNDAVRFTVKGLGDPREVSIPVHRFSPPAKEVKP